MPDVGRGIGTEDAHGRTENNEERHNRDQSENLGQDEIRGRVHPHDVECIDLLCYAHRAQFRGDVRAYLSSENQTHDARGELQKHNLPSGVARHPPRHPRTLDIELHLNTDHRSDEEGDQQDDAHRVDPQLRHLLDITLEEHPHPFGSRKRPSH